MGFIFDRRDERNLMAIACAVTGVVKYSDNFRSGV